MDPAATTEQRATERRRHPRQKIRVLARLGLVGYMADGFLEDIAAGGVCFRTEDPLLCVAAGNFVTVAFAARHGGKVVDIERTVRVTRIEDEDPDQRTRTMGLEFDEVLTMEGLTFAG